MQRQSTQCAMCLNGLLAGGLSDAVHSLQFLGHEFRSLAIAKLTAAAQATGTHVGFMFKATLTQRLAVLRGELFRLAAHEKK